MTTPDDDDAKVGAAIAALKAVPVKRQPEVLAARDASLLDVDPKTKRKIWAGIFAVLGVALVGALLLILRSWNVDLITTTGTGTTAVRAVTHPDVSAAWALASSVVAGVVGLLAPSPVSSTGAK